MLNVYCQPQNKSDLLNQYYFGFRKVLEKSPINHFNDCKKIIKYFERYYNIPANLLAAISLVESGQKPWVINRNGHGYCFPNAKSLSSFLKKKPLGKVKCAYVGCMQICYRTHSKNRYFKNKNDLFKPYYNIGYAAKHLSDLKKRYGSWKKAVGYYNSCNTKKANRYIYKVRKAYSKIKNKNSI